MRLRICFVLCQGSDTSTRNIATRARTSFLACLCAVKVAELWDRLTWFVWTVFCFVKDDVLDADPGRSRGFEGKATFYRCGRSGVGCFCSVDRPCGTFLLLRHGFGLNFPFGHFTFGCR